ncbi:MAG: acyl-phosphate glycerol 3-phosphate acyltransferase [Candidatus Aminicenantes bacterium RBG_13_64_14]|nr:MAG: acyl-phosphate glycerol 3-phosphate acyltransferase [Candidatus Aminicenantes bacterium RBG_13_64_14]
MRIFIAAAAYLVGSIPTGYLLVRLTARKDIRQFGSRSMGATNVLRVKGWRAALPVAVIDVLKGFLPAFFALKYYGDPVFAAFCAFLSVVGHCFPFSIGFKGGKGVATSLGAYAAIAWVPLLACLGLFLMIVAVSRHVSLGSLVGSLAFPFLVLLTGGPKGVFAISLAITALVVFQHRGNIGRLVKGTERKLGDTSP